MFFKKPVYNHITCRLMTLSDNRLSFSCVVGSTHFLLYLLSLCITKYEESLHPKHILKSVKPSATTAFAHPSLNTRCLSLLKSSASSDSSSSEILGIRNVSHPTSTLHPFYYTSTTPFFTPFHPFPLLIYPSESDLRHRHRHPFCRLYSVDPFPSTLDTRFAEMVTKCHKFGFFGKIKIQFREPS